MRGSGGVRGVAGPRPLGLLPPNGAPFFGGAAPSPRARGAGVGRGAQAGGCPGRPPRRRRLSVGTMLGAASEDGYRRKIVDVPDAASPCVSESPGPGKPSG